MHKPGIVPLRPLTLGEIFDGSLKTMRRNPEATLGLALVVMLAFAVPATVGTILLSRLATVSLTDLAAVSLALGVLLSGIGSLALSGFVIYVVSEAALGDKVSIGQTWRAVRGRLLSLVGVTLLTLLIFLAIALVSVLLVTGLAFGAAQGGGGGALVGGGALLLVVLVLPLVLWLSARLSLAPAAVVLERASPTRGIGRSWQLTRGRSAWRVLGITVLAGLVAQIFAAVVGTPITAITDSLVGGSGLDPQGELTASLAIQQLISVLVNALVTPFTAGVTALLYLDMRFRREGLDVTLIQAAQQRAAARRT